MEYTKIRLDFKYAEKGRFYRSVLVRSDLDLKSIGTAFVYALGGTLEHCFLYRSNGVSYFPYEWIEDFYNIENCLPYEEASLDDLSDTFSFEYDTGDGWDFACKKYKRKVNLDSDRVIIVLEGEIDKDYDGEDEERGIYKPWNFDIDKYSEFDNPLDIEALNDELDFDEVFEKEK